MDQGTIVPRLRKRPQPHFAEVAYSSDGRRYKALAKPGGYVESLCGRVGSGCFIWIVWRTSEDLKQHKKNLAAARRRAEACEKRGYRHVSVEARN